MFAPPATYVGPFLAFVRAGHAGVDLFFVLSAFLLSLPFLAEIRGGPVVSRRNYFLRRGLRLVPLYYTLLLLGILINVRHLRDLLPLWPYAFFLPIAHPALEPVSTVWWSLNTEWQFYVILPLLALVTRGSGGQRRGAIVLGVYSAAYVAFLAGLLAAPSIGAQFTLIFSLFGRGSLFLWGILAAWIYRTHGTTIRDALAARSWLSRGGADAVLLALFIAMARLLQWATIDRDAWDNVPDQGWHVIEGALWAAMVLVVLLAPLNLKAVVVNPLLGKLGEISYSIYMWHQTIIAVALSVLAPWHVGGLGWDTRAFTAAALISLACVGVSQLSYTVIERPFLVRKTRLAP